MKRRTDDSEAGPLVNLACFLLICVTLFMTVGLTVYALFRRPRAGAKPSAPPATEFERGMMRALARMTRMGE